MRLAHCSDLHLLSHDGARWLDLANKRWIGAMNLLSNRSRHYHVAAFDDMIADLNALGIDHVLCTGDVTNLALRQEFAFARGKFDRLALGPSGVTVIPGNHDAYVAEGVGLFEELFAPFAASDPGWAWAKAGAGVDAGAEAGAGEPDAPDAPDDLHWPIVRVRGELALIGTSTSRQTPWFTAYGRLGPGQLARLRRVLVDPRLADKIRIVAIHHPPAGKRAASRIRGLRDHAAFAEVIAGAGAHLIVHGHEHRDMTEALAGPGGPVPVRGIASGTYCHNRPERTARYRIYELEGGQVVSDHVRVWDRERRAFTAEPTQSNPTT
ncbi:MAG TPA: metallophosphoesterase [Kofleriaceae bacterium]|nr:metallophosphoesterase [Kofleriaceae bacterium]